MLVLNSGALNYPLKRPAYGRGLVLLSPLSLPGKCPSLRLANTAPLYTGVRASGVSQSRCPYFLVHGGPAKSRPRPALPAPSKAGHARAGQEAGLAWAVAKSLPGPSPMGQGRPCAWPSYAGRRLSVGGHLRIRKKTRPRCRSGAAMEPGKKLRLLNPRLPPGSGCVRALCADSHLRCRVPAPTTAAWPLSLHISTCGRS